nr:hypothetical protein [Tanacetum cinerariifolium]
ENVVGHIANFLGILDPIKIVIFDIDRLRLNIFPLSLTGAARVWWSSKGNNKIAAWGILVGRFFYKYFPLSRDGKNYVVNSHKMNGHGYYELMAWMDSKHDDKLIDRMTKSALCHTRVYGWGNDESEYDIVTPDMAYPPVGYDVSNFLPRQRCIDIQEYTKDTTTDTITELMVKEVLEKVVANSDSCLINTKIDYDSINELCKKIFMELQYNTFGEMEEEDVVDGKNYVANSHKMNGSDYHELMAWMDSKHDDKGIDRMTKSALCHAWVYGWGNDEPEDDIVSSDEE